MRPNHQIVRPRRSGTVLATLLSVIGLSTLIVWAGPVGAHIEPTTTTGEAGRRADIGFVPTHGCGANPTTGIDIQLPDGVVDPLPAELEGWTVAVDGSVVIWGGGPLPDGDEAMFSVNVLLPDTPGTTLYFPTIQRCPGDESLAWIQQPGDGTDQSFPAPAVAVVEATGPPGTTSPPPVTSPPTTMDETTAPPTTDPTTVLPASTTAPQATLVERESDSGGSSLLPVLIALGGVIVVAAGAIIYYRRRSED
jgi:uncharacterized protein YcnI